MPGCIAFIPSRFIMVVYMLSSLLLPLAVDAQQLVPVTVEVTFPGANPLSPQSITPSIAPPALVFDHLTHPPSLTTNEKETETREKAAAPGLRLRQRPLTVGGYGRYERVEFDTPGAALDLDGNIYSLNAQLAWDIDNFSFGALIPYDFLDLDSLDAHRIGTIVFGQYNWPISPLATLHFTINGTYTHTAIDGADLSDLNTFGGGASVSVTLDKGRFMGSGTLAYQFSADDSDSIDDHQHLLKLGIIAGVRLGRNAVVSLFGTWTADVTDYSALLGDIDQEYFDLGLELSWSLSSTWRLTGGYKTILGLENFASHQVFLGTLFRF